MNSQLARHAAVAALSVIAGTVVNGPTVHADIISTTGSAQIVEAPESVMRGAWESNTHTRVFQEQSNFTLQSNLGVDISLTGTCASPEDCSPMDIAAGTIVNSYFVHQDAVGRHGHIFLHSSITFDQTILGVIVSNANLNASDPVLGALGTLYPTGTDLLRTLDYPQAQDAVTISDDRHTISLDLQTQVAMDHIRIITAAGPVPAPGSLALLAMAGLTAFGRRARRA